MERTKTKTSENCNNHVSMSAWESPSLYAIYVRFPIPIAEYIYFFDTDQSLENFHTSVLLHNPVQEETLLVPLEEAIQMSENDVEICSDIKLPGEKVKPQKNYVKRSGCACAIITLFLSFA